MLSSDGQHSLSTDQNNSQGNTMKSVPSKRNGNKKSMRKQHCTNKRTSKLMVDTSEKPALDEPNLKRQRVSVDRPKISENSQQMSEHSGNSQHSNSHGNDGSTKMFNLKKATPESAKQTDKNLQKQLKQSTLKMGAN